MIECKPTIGLVIKVKSIQIDNQWKEQELCHKKIQIATESFNLLHLVSLVQIYDDLTKLGEKLKSDPKSNVKNVKSWTCMCRYSKRHHDEFSLPQKI